MGCLYRRSYVGTLKGVILDWAGTTVDYGCFAPVQVFVEVFQQCGITVTTQQARLPMGLGKKDHIRAIAQMEPADKEQQWTGVDQGGSRPPCPGCARRTPG